MGLFYSGEMLSENFWRKLWHWREPFSSLVYYVSQLNIIASLFLPENVCISLYVIIWYMFGKKRHSPHFFFFVWDTYSRKFPSWYHLLFYNTSHLRLAPAPFLFCCSVGEYINSFHNLYSILQIRNWPRHSDCKISPSAPIFFSL